MQLIRGLNRFMSSMKRKNVDYWRKEDTGGASVVSLDCDRVPSISARMSSFTLSTSLIHVACLDGAGIAARSKGTPTKTRLSS